MLLPLYGTHTYTHHQQQQLSLFSNILSLIDVFYVRANLINDAWNLGQDQVLTFYTAPKMSKHITEHNKTKMMEGWVAETHSKDRVGVNLASSSFPITLLLLDPHNILFIPKYINTTCSVHVMLLYVYIFSWHWKTVSHTPHSAVAYSSLLVWGLLHVPFLLASLLVFVFLLQFL